MSVLVWSAILLGLTALLGAALAILHTGLPGVPRPSWALGGLHGVLGAAGLAVLVVALWRQPGAAAAARAKMGTGGFGAAAAWVLGLALLAGLGPILARIRRAPISGLVIGLHATLAIMGVVILAAYVSLPG